MCLSRRSRCRRPSLDAALQTADCRGSQPAHPRRSGRSTTATICAASSGSSSRPDSGLVQRERSGGRSTWSRRTPRTSARSGEQYPAVTSTAPSPRSPSTAPSTTRVFSASPGADPDCWCVWRVAVRPKDARWCGRSSFASRCRQLEAVGYRRGPRGLSTGRPFAVRTRGRTPFRAVEGASGRSRRPHHSRVPR